MKDLQTHFQAKPRSGAKVYLPKVCLRGEESSRFCLKFQTVDWRVG